MTKPMKSNCKQASRAVAHDAGGTVGSTPTSGIHRKVYKQRKK